ncbi:MAG: hypothetical protein H0U91_15265 [Rubrobacter sp.]|jgi:hypothetical protein|nr:hypothetical protein [Rubrobacter sp.]MBA3950831.1 hypothetical protein [Rubrobacter sp.]
MDEASVTRTPASPTRVIVVDDAFCGQAAAVLLCDPAPIRDAFLGEPVEEALEMVRWALKHERDPGFDASRALPSWARRRGRGAWRANRWVGAPDDGDGRG